MNRPSGDSSLACSRSVTPVWARRWYGRPAWFTKWPLHGDCQDGRRGWAILRRGGRAGHGSSSSLPLMLLAMIVASESVSESESSSKSSMSTSLSLFQWIAVELACSMSLALKPSNSPSLSSVAFVAINARSIAASVRCSHDGKTVAVRTTKTA